MKENICIRKLNANEIENALDLTWRVFVEYEAPDYTREGVDEFYKSIHDESFVSKLDFYGAFHISCMIGVIAARNEGSHIALFFVDGKYHRQGIGKSLFEYLRANCNCNKMTVNSSPYAIEIYRRLGFKETDTEQVVNGLRFTPMELNL